MSFSGYWYHLFWLINEIRPSPSKSNNILSQNRHRCASQLLFPTALKEHHCASVENPCQSMTSQTWIEVFPLKITEKSPRKIHQWLHVSCRRLRCLFGLQLLCLGFHLAKEKELSMEISTFPWKKRHTSLGYNHSSVLRLKHDSIFFFSICKVQHLNLLKPFDDPQDS